MRVVFVLEIRILKRRDREGKSDQAFLSELIRELTTRFFVQAFSV